MKKLNKKGFTLIELLAVIVILAIIVVVTVPTILNSINNARISSISSLSKEVANQYDTAVAQDLIASTPSIPNKASTEWECISDIGGLTEALDLSITDLSLGGEPYNGTTVYADTCSSIKINSNGSAEVLLVAGKDGKFAISGKTVYARSSDDDGSDAGNTGNTPVQNNG